MKSMIHSVTAVHVDNHIYNFIDTSQCFSHTHHVTLYTVFYAGRPGSILLLHSCFNLSHYLSSVWIHSIDI